MAGPIAGFQGLLKIAAATVAQVQEVDADFEAALEDVSVMGDRARDFLPTLYKATIKAKLEYDMTDTTGQLAIQNAFFANPPTLLAMTFSPANGATNTTYTMSCYVAKISIKDAVDKVISNDVDLQPTGPLSVV